MLHQALTNNLCPAPQQRGFWKDDFFEGLPDGVKPFDLVRLVRDVGHEFGLTGSDIQHLDYLVSHTKIIDWQFGNMPPVVYKSVALMARERGVTVRQIHKLERKLAETGLLRWRDAGNFRRYGARDQEGRIDYAYGVDLSPLVDQYDRLKEFKHRQADDLQHFIQGRRQVSAIRRRIMMKIVAAQDAKIDVEAVAEAFAALAKVRANTTLRDLSRIQADAMAIEKDLDQALEEAAVKEAKNGASPVDNHQIVPTSRNNSSDTYNTTNNPPSVNTDTCNRDKAQVVHDKEEVAKTSAIETGIEHISLKQALTVATDDFINSVWPTGGRIGIADIIDAASRRCHHLGVSKSAWIDACTILGREAATIAVIIIDRKMKCPILPVRSPGGALRGMTKKALAGDLHLHRSIYGLIERDRAGGVK